MGEAERRLTLIGKFVQKGEDMEEYKYGPGPSGELCETCYYWVKDRLKSVDVKEDEGDCRKETPKVFMVIGQNPLGQPQPATLCYFPRTVASRWCGEWRTLQYDK